VPVAFAALIVRSWTSVIDVMFWASRVWREPEGATIVVVFALERDHPAVLS